MYDKVHHFIHKSKKNPRAGGGHPLPHVSPLVTLRLVTYAYNDFTPSYAPDRNVEAPLHFSLM